MNGDISLDDLIKKDRQQGKLGKNKPIKKNARKDVVKARRNRLNNQPDRKIKNKLGKGKQSANNQIPQNNNIRRIQQLREYRQKQQHKNAPQFNRKDQGKNSQKNSPPVQKKAKQEAQKPERGKTLRVYGLQSDVTNQELYKIFAAQGALEKCFIEQDNFGRKMPSAIVKYYNAEAAHQAVTKFKKHKIRDSVFDIQILGKQ